MSLKAISSIALSGFLLASILQASNLPSVAELGANATPTFLCAEGKLLSKPATLRSDRGAFCKIEVIAVLAEAMCPTAQGIDKPYAGSQCQKNAIAAIAGRKASDVLNQHFPSATQDAKDLLCAMKGELKDKSAKSSLDKLCPKAPKEPKVDKVKEPKAEKSPKTK